MDQDEKLPLLPPELERSIFEWAWYDQPEDAPRLLLVAKRVNAWLEPLIYRVFCVSTRRIYPPAYLKTAALDCDTFKQPLNTCLLDRFGMHANHILFQRAPIGHIMSVLQRTPNVTSLALWWIRGVLLTLLPILTSLPNLSTLSFDPSCFFMAYSEDIPIPFDLPLFRNIKDLEIVNMTPSWTKWQKLAELPKLKRLALAGRLNDEILDAILGGCSHLESLVIYTAGTLPITKGGPSGHPGVSFQEFDTNLVESWERKTRSTIFKYLG